MKWATILTGACAVGLLTLGLNIILPLGGPLDGLCDVLGLASATAFLGLLEGA